MEVVGCSNYTWGTRASFNRVSWLFALCVPCFLRLLFTSILSPSFLLQSLLLVFSFKQRIICLVFYLVILHMLGVIGLGPFILWLRPS